MLKILKASAGSGKTYNLAKEYIRLVVGSGSPEAYRHILAVTFTNKATDEMKKRILKELFILSTDPDKSNYLNDLVPETVPDKVTLQKRASAQLSGILHDYSAFAVSTIDKFFQQTLRSFSREIGQFSSYQVQLDKKALAQESVDRVLDNISEEDKSVLEWLTDSAKSDLEQKGFFKVDDRLLSMATSLGKLKEEDRKFFTRDELKNLNDLCKEIRSGYEESVKIAAQKVVDAVESCGITTNDFSRKFLSKIYIYINQDKSNAVEPPTDAFVRSASDPSLWFTKANAKLKDSVEPVVYGPLMDFLACFEKDYKLYLTADLISRQVYTLGMAAELADAFVQVQKDNNIISIDDSNTILKHIIDGTDTPFIYEKLGVRFDDFLLDEFQDTSDVQWDNFRPLLHGSIDSGNTSLVVGDVKQSIYRWRGSDWNLLGHRLEEEFDSPKITVLEENHRTCHEIVRFNNEFFKFAAEVLDQNAGQDPESAQSFSTIYKDVVQIPKLDEKALGSVEVVFTDDQLAEIVDTINDLTDNRGAQFSDIAILVRNNSEGTSIAETLIANELPVVSDDSLFVKASITVRRLVSQLSLVDVPEHDDKPSVAGYLAASLGVNIPERYHSLVDLAESLLRDLSNASPDTFEAEIPYIQSFMDYLQDWVNINGNNLSAFLKSWADADVKIASPESGNSIRVMTIHKSKGLEFPYVIFPFAEKVTLYKHSPSWCEPDIAGTPMEGKAEGMYYVDLTDGSSQSLFEKDYARERRMQAIDNINVFYVAMTRPKCGLKVIAAPSSGSGKLTNMAQILRMFTGADSSLRGEPFDFTTLKREKKENKVLRGTYLSFPAESGERLKFSPEASDYFGEDGSFGPDASRRIRGNVLHGILSRVMVADDLPKAVDSAILAGELPKSSKDEALKFLKERIESVQSRGWFSKDARVSAEVAILAPGEGEYRPDRVVFHPDSRVDVIDFKFGKPLGKYQSQVRRYVSLYRSMGFEKVEGYLWYLDDNLINFVADNN